MPRWAALKRFIREVYLLLDDLIDPLPAPGRPILIRHREVVMGQKIGYTLGCPELPANSDVAKLRLHVSVDGTEQPPVDMTTGQVFEVVAPVGSKVDAFFTAVDDAGNESPHGTAWDITVVDDIAPPAPGSPVLVSKRDVFDTVPPAGGTPPPTGGTVPPAPPNAPPPPGIVPPSI